MCYLREAKFPLSTEEASDTDDRKPIDDADEVTIFALNGSLFASVWQLSRLTHLSPTIVYRRLTQSLRFRERHLRLVPSALSDAQKTQQVTLSRHLLRIWEVRHDRTWSDIVTLNESRLYLRTDHEFIWLPRREKVPEWEGHTILLKKFMPTIVWNPRDSHFIHVLEKGRKFNAMHYVTQIFLPLSGRCAFDAPERDRKLIVHADNAGPRTARLSIEFFEDNLM
jgi:hypothetical protein